MNLTPLTMAYENIENACRKRIRELYPHGIPEVAAARLEEELAYLKASDCVDDFEIFRLFTEEARKSCQFFFLRGNIAGSYLIYLLGDNSPNPLPTHYYCPECGHFEMVDTALFGIDLPENTCPVCGNKIYGDGFHLPIESIWGDERKNQLSFDYNVSTDFLPFAKKVLKKLYFNHEVIPCAHWHPRYTSENREPSFKVNPGGFIILPLECTIDDYPDLITYMENGDRCLMGSFMSIRQYSLKKITLLPSDSINQLLILQKKTATYIREIPMTKLRELSCHDLVNSRKLSYPEDIYLTEYKPKTFFELIGLLGMAHNSYTESPGINPDFSVINKILASPEFEKYPCYFREDFFEYAVEAGLTREKAYELSEKIRKGHSGRPDFDSSQLPEELTILAQKYRYIFPRAHWISYFFLYAKLAYFMKLDSKLYSKIIF